jgi:hypothetical protein
MTRYNWIARSRKQPSNSPFRKRGKRPQPGFQPFLEALEERYLLSGNYLVNSSDGGAASGTGNSGNLRYCIAGAESGGGGGTVTFSSAALGADPTITLSGGQGNITYAWP